MKKILEDIEDIINSYSCETTTKIHNMDVETYDTEDVILFNEISTEHNLYCRALFVCVCVGLLNTAYMFLIGILAISLTTLVTICFSIQLFLGILIAATLYKITKADTKMFNFLENHEKKEKKLSNERVLIKG